MAVDTYVELDSDVDVVNYFKTLFGPFMERAFMDGAARVNLSNQSLLQLCLFISGPNLYVTTVFPSGELKIRCDQIYFISVVIFKILLIEVNSRTFDFSPVLQVLDTPHTTVFRFRNQHLPDGVPQTTQLDFDSLHRTRHHDVIPESTHLLHIQLLLWLQKFQYLRHDLHAAKVL